MYVTGSLLRCFHVVSHIIKRFSTGKADKGGVRKSRKRAREQEKAKSKARGVISSSRLGDVNQLQLSFWDKDLSPVSHVKLLFCFNFFDGRGRQGKGEIFFDLIAGNTPQRRCDRVCFVVTANLDWSFKTCCSILKSRINNTNCCK